MNTKKTASATKRKIAAIAAGALVVGIGATYTLASWTDSEWVWGGAAGDTPGVGTDTFEVQQDTSNTFANSAWNDRETNPGGALTFSAGQLSLSPGDAIYAPVALRTTAPSVAGTVTLRAAVAAAGVTPNDTSGELWNAIDVAVYTQKAATTPFTRLGNCDASVATDTTNWTQVTGVSDLSTAASVTQTLDAASGSVQHYCFVLTLPTGSPDSLQGRTIAPAWEFRSVSN